MYVLIAPPAHSAAEAVGGNPDDTSPQRPSKSASGESSPFALLMALLQGVSLGTATTASPAFANAGTAETADEAAGLSAASASPAASTTATAPSGFSKTLVSLGTSNSAETIAVAQSAPVPASAAEAATPTAVSTSAPGLPTVVAPVTEAAEDEAQTGNASSGAPKSPAKSGTQEPAERAPLQAEPLPKPAPLAVAKEGPAAAKTAVAAASQPGAEPDPEAPDAAQALTNARTKLNIALEEAAEPAPGKPAESRPGAAAKLPDDANRVLTANSREVFAVNASGIKSPADRPDAVFRADSSDPPTLKTLQDFTVKSVRYLLSHGERTISVRLVPESLGELRIEVTSANNVVTVRMASASLVVRETLEQQIHGLREALTRDGLDLAKATVSAQMSPDHGARSYPGRQTPHFPHGNAPPGTDGPAAPERLAEAAWLFRRQRAHDGSLNLYA